MDEHARQQTTVAADNGEAPRRARMPSGNAPFSVCTTNKYPHGYARESERVARVRVRKFWGRTEGRKGCSRGGLIISVIVAVIGAGCQMAHAQQACTFDDGYNGVYISQGGETRQSETCPEYMSCTGANKCSRNIQGIKYCSEVDIDGFCVACQDGHVLGKCGDGNR